MLAILASPGSGSGRSDDGSDRIRTGGDDTERLESVESRMTARTLRTAILRHDLPGHRSHFDWLVEWSPPPVDSGATLVPTFRVDRRLDAAAPGTVLRATRIPDHRPLYLALTEVRVLDAGRGVVTPRRQGRVVGARRLGEGWRLDLAWEDAARPSLIEAMPVKGDEWRIRVLDSRST